jgi:hypothetical protein
MQKRGTFILFILGAIFLFGEMSFSKTKPVMIAQLIPDSPIPPKTDDKNIKNTYDNSDSAISEFNHISAINRYIAAFNRYYKLKVSCNAIGFYALAKGLRIPPRNLLELAMLFKANEKKIRNYGDKNYFRKGNAPETDLLDLISFFNTRYNATEALASASNLLNYNFAQKNYALITFAIKGTLPPRQVIKSLIFQEYSNHAYYSKAQDICMGNI